MIQSAEGFFRPFLENVVAPNAATFAPLIALGEFTVGVTLVLGLFTRLGAITAMWLTLNYMLAKGLAAGGGSTDRLFFALDLAFLLGSAGLAWALDGVRRRELGANPVTRWLAGIPESPEQPAQRPAAAPASAGVPRQG